MPLTTRTKEYKEPVNWCLDSTAECKVDVDQCLAVIHSEFMKSVQAELINLCTSKKKTMNLRSCTNHYKQSIAKLRSTFTDESIQQACEKQKIGQIADQSSNQYDIQPIPFDPRTPMSRRYIFVKDPNFKTSIKITNEENNDKTGESTHSTDVNKKLEFDKDI